MKTITTSLAMLAALSGCASIVSGSSQNINLSTNPPASVICDVKNERGEWKVSPIPGSLLLKRSKSPLSIKCEGAGYYGEYSKGGELEGWTVGNILFGGIVGLVIDAGTGAMFSYDDAIVVPVKLKDPFEQNSSSTPSWDAAPPRVMDNAPVVEKTTTTTTTTETTSVPSSQPSSYDDLVKSGAIVEAPATQRKSY